MRLWPSGESAMALKWFWYKVVYSVRINFRKVNFQKHPFIVAAVSVLLSMSLLLWAMQLIHLQDAAAAFIWIFTHPLASLCTIFLTGLVMAGVYALTKRLWAGYLLPGLFCLLLAFVNYFKCAINSAPLLLSDFTMARQLLEISGYAKSRLVFSFESVLAIAVVVFTLAGLIFVDLTVKKGITRRGRIAWLCVTLAVFLFVLFTPAFTAFSANISSAQLTQEERNDAFGVLYGLYCAYASVQSNAVDYSKDDIDALLGSEQQADAQEPEKAPDSEQNNGQAAEGDAPDVSEAEPVIPNVIFVMSESFFDITRLPNLTFSEDPLANYHALAEDYTSGPFMTPAYCGGTAYVEMEVLTGLTSFLLKENDTLTAFPTNVYAQLPTVQGVFAGHGYDTVFFHSHTNALYNRDPIYNAMGFDQVLFSDACAPDAEMKGGYVSDKAFAEKIISLYQQRDKDVPLFMLNVSMENHQPYTANKYTEHSGIDASSPYLNEEDLAILDSYVMGVHDADASLGMLVDYFSTVDEPVMLVFWGDHLPNLNLSDGTSIFTKLGYASDVMTTDWGPEELAQMLSTEYLIWTNYEEDDEIQPDHTESCTFLGVHVLQRIGLELNSYFSWLEQNVMPYMIIYRARLFVDAEGKPYRDIPEDYQQMMDAYRLMVYDLVYGERRITQDDVLKE